jgi:hypothetical protein
MTLSIQDRLAAAERTIAELRASGAKPIISPPPKPQRWTQMRYSLEVQDLCGGCPGWETRKQFNLLAAAVKEAEARSAKRGGWPIVLCDWRTSWSEAVKAKFPDAKDRFGSNNANCILVIETVEAIAEGGCGYTLVRDWPYANKPMKGTIQTGDIT